MKLEASAKTSSAGKKPRIKKGYYPAKLMEVNPYNDKDGNLKACKYGSMLIFRYAVFKQDPETDAPTVPMTHTLEVEGQAKKTVDVELSQFVYHLYKNKETSDLQTAITPNSGITKLLKALGWTFSSEGVEIDDLIGNWVELNINDYEDTFGDEKYLASTVDGVNPYKGPEVKSEKKAEPKSEKAKKEEAPKTVAPKVEEEKIEDEKPKSDTIAKIKKKLADLKQMNKDGIISDSGLAQAKENLEAQLLEAV